MLLLRNCLFGGSFSSNKFLRLSGATPYVHLCIKHIIMKSILALMGSQWSSTKASFELEYFEYPSTSFALMFCIR